MPQLCPGDLMLKARADGFVNKAIAFGQRVRGQTNPLIVHAGIMFDSHYIIEAQGSGVSGNDIRVQNLHYGYLVFRPHNPQIAAGAATCAKMMFDIHQTQQNLGYTIRGALGSLFGSARGPRTRNEFEVLFDRVITGRKHPFFCSQFVVFVYQFVAEQMNLGAGALFPYRDPKVSPSLLGENLVNNTNFFEAGYVMPNE
jgi:hypothetical protein